MGIKKKKIYKDEDKIEDRECKYGYWDYINRKHIAEFDNKS